ncbi:MAG: NAD(P)-binding domain-containing protein [Acidimicrobiales bacterium]
MQTTTVLIIGAGQAGLAMSRCLTQRSIDHVLLERGVTAHSWRTERWDSLRLLTPNWLSRLPGWTYRGDDPDGYMSASEVVRYLDDYRRSFAAPLQTETTVESVASTSTGFLVATDQGPWACRSVVVATGACSTPKIPAVGRELPSDISQLAAIHYRNPDRIEDGRVLVVGGSASGAQIADELARAGRDVTLAVGEHVRLPRTYRGRDIHWWMDAVGQLDERYDEMDDIVRARRLPSLQLVGSPEKRTLDLNALAESGVSLVGRLVGVSNGKAQLSGSLANVCAAADLKQARLLDLIDEYAARSMPDADLDAPHRPEPTSLTTPPTVLELGGFTTVIWATGFRPRYPWLGDHLLDRKGAIRHDGGVMEEPGLYMLGMPFTRRRKSSFLDGVGPDAQFLSAHLARLLDRQARRPRIAVNG